jgi:hypothetical protein
MTIASLRPCVFALDLFPKIAGMDPSWHGVQALAWSFLVERKSQAKARTPCRRNNVKMKRCS